jgi:hypothetical protein
MLFSCFVHYFKAFPGNPLMFDICVTKFYSKLGARFDNLVEED